MVLMSNCLYSLLMNEKAYPSQQLDKFQLRMPSGMRERIRIAAEKSGRSMNAEIVARLEESFRTGETFERFNVMSVALDEKLEKVREEIDHMEKSKSEAADFIKQLETLTKQAEKEE